MVVYVISTWTILGSVVPRVTNQLNCDSEDDIPLPLMDVAITPSCTPETLTDTLTDESTSEGTTANGEKERHYPVCTWRPPNHLTC